MSQNIDQYLKNIKYEGSYLVDVQSCIDINQLSFARQKYFKKQKPDPNDIQNYFEKSLQVSKETIVSETIAEVGLHLKEQPFEHVEAKIMFDHRISRELYKRVQQSLTSSGNKTLFDIYDLFYVTRIRMNLEHNPGKEKELTLRQITNYINWILLHQNGLRSFQTSQGIVNPLTRSLKKRIQRPILTTIYLTIKIHILERRVMLIIIIQEEIKGGLIGIAHVCLIQLPQLVSQANEFISNTNENISQPKESQILIVIGFNTLKTELFHALENFREFNYERVRLPVQFIPTYTVDGLCSILYHYFSVIRKILKQKDSHHHDTEVKKILSANSDVIIKNPQKSKNLPKLPNFEFCYFQLFEIAQSIDQLTVNLDSFSFRKVLVLNLIDSLDTLFLLDTEDMAYNLVNTTKYLLTCFQYKNTNNAELRTMPRTQAYEQIIQRIYQIVHAEIDLPTILKQKKKKHQRGLHIDLDKISASQTPRQKDDINRSKSQPRQNQNQNQNQVSQVVKNSMNTAMKWFDENKYSARKDDKKNQKFVGSGVIESIAYFPNDLDPKEQILKQNLMLDSMERETRRINTSQKHLDGFKKGVIVEEADLLRLLDSLLKKLDLNFQSNITQTFQNPSQILQKVLTIINLKTEIVNDLLPVIYINYERTLGRIREIPIKNVIINNQKQDICQITLHEELDFFCCKLLQHLQKNIEKVYSTIEFSQSNQIKHELLDFFFNFVFNKYVNKKERSFDLVTCYIQNDASILFQEFQLNPMPKNVFDESFLPQVLMTYFNTDVFEEFNEYLTKLIDLQIDFTNEDSIIILELTSEAGYTPRLNMKDRIYLERKLFEKIFQRLFCEEQLLVMPKQMIYLFHHLSKILDRENQINYRGQIHDEDQIKDHYYKWAFLSCVYLYTVIQPLIDKEVLVDRSFTLTQIYDQLVSAKKSRNRSQSNQITTHLQMMGDGQSKMGAQNMSSSEASLAEGIKLRKVLTILLHQPTDMTRENMLIIRRFFRKIDDLYYQNRMISFTVKNSGANGGHYYDNLKSLEHVYVNKKQDTQLKYQSAIKRNERVYRGNQMIILENQDIPAELKDRSIFLAQNYMVKAKHLCLLLQSFNQYLYQNFHNPHDFEGSMKLFMDRSKLVQSFQSQFGNSDDYIVLNTDQYPVDSIEIMLKYQNLYKEGFPNVALKDDEILQFLRLSSIQQSQGFVEILQRMHQLPEYSQEVDHPLINPYQIIFDQIKLPELANLIQDLINCQKIGRDILDTGKTSYYSDQQGVNLQLLKTKVPQLIQNQRSLQNYLIISDVINNDLAIIEKDSILLKQKSLISSQFAG